VGIPDSQYDPFIDISLSLSRRINPNLFQLQFSKAWEACFRCKPLLFQRHSSHLDLEPTLGLRSKYIQRSNLPTLHALNDIIATRDAPWFFDFEFSTDRLQQIRVSRMSLQVPMQAAIMLLNGTQLTDPTKDDTEGRATMADELPVEEEAARRERSREYRRRYKQRQKDKDQMLQSQLEATEMELQRLRLEQAALLSQSQALSSLCTYSNSMIESLTAAASASVTKARYLGGQAMEGVNTFRGWAKHQWIMLPTATELLMGSVWTPTDDHMRIVMTVSKPEDFVTNHIKFLDRLAQLLEEGKRSPEAKQHAELKINYLLSIWVSWLQYQI